MRTTKPISTISFNTPQYLAVKLDELQKAKRISFWAFIIHKPEDDEGGKKQHMHVYIEPSKMLQTDDIKDELKEFDPCNPSKPLGCISFNSSKFDTWYLYALHDKAYLATKGQTRRYHYLHEELYTSDPDELLYKSKSIDLLSISPYASMQEAIYEGISFDQYFRRGTIPIAQVKLYEFAWNLLTHPDITNRNGYEGHE